MKKQELHFCLSCCGSSSVIYNLKVYLVWDLWMFLKILQNVTCAVYSLNRGERLNIDKSLIYLCKACNSIAFIHFLLAINSWGGYIFLASVLSFSELIMCLLYCCSLVLWRLSSQWCIPNTNALRGSVLDIEL